MVESEIPIVNEAYELEGQRLDQRGKKGTIRFKGELINNAKAGKDVWLGVEWDDAEAGKH